MKTTTTTSSLMSPRFRLVSLSPMTAGMPEKTGAGSPGPTFELYLPAAKAGLTAKARTARLRSVLRIGANSSMGLSGNRDGLSRGEAGRDPEQIPERDPLHPEGPCCLRTLRNRGPPGDRES